jgi:hypothetical protein
MKTNTDSTVATKAVKTVKTIKTGKVGRPAFDLKYPRGTFTYADAFALNPEVCKLTVRNHVDEKVAENFLTKLDKTVKTGKPGKPAFLFIRTAMAKAAEARRKPSAETPVVPEGVAEVAVSVNETVPATEDVVADTAAVDPMVIAGPVVAA